LAKSGVGKDKTNSKIKMQKSKLIINNFSEACSKIREAVYGIKAFSQISQNQFNISTGTAFMITPGILVTTAHLCHIQNDPAQPRHSNFTVIRAPDIGQQMERCIFIAEDVERDIALLKIVNPRSTLCVKLTKQRIVPGTPVGSIGFPLAFIDPNTGTFHLIERFQGAYISSFHPITAPTGRELYSYETDALMYKGSSGCPGFLVNGEVFGMHNASIVNQPRISERERQQEIRLAISLWVPAEDIIKFAKNNNIEI